MQIIAKNIRQAILDCNIPRLTLAETHQLSRLKSRQWISKSFQDIEPSLDKALDYIAEYREDIQEIYGLQKRLGDRKQRENRPMQSNRSKWKIIRVYWTLSWTLQPSSTINAIRDFDQGKEYSHMADINMMKDPGQRLESELIILLFSAASRSR